MSRYEAVCPMCKRAFVTSHEERRTFCSVGCAADAAGPRLCGVCETEHDETRKCHPADALEVLKRHHTDLLAECDAKQALLTQIDRERTAAHELLIEIGEFLRNYHQGDYAQSNDTKVYREKIAEVVKT